MNSGVGVWDWRDIESSSPEVRALLEKKAAEDAATEQERLDPALIYPVADQHAVDGAPDLLVRINNGPTVKVSR